ncbi:MAG: DUF4242 domain-containing protein [Acidimicrobiia bacterium]|nr:DUF4242 domain-containing protein [Acidimicrobiia bacterium]
MERYVIERDIEGIGEASPAELQEGSQRSCDAIETLFPRVQWEQSFVTADKIYCVYLAEDETAITEHATLAGFPASRVSRVAAVTDPTSAGPRHQAADPQPS